MGQIVNPIALRLGVTKTWSNHFFLTKFASNTDLLLIQLTVFLQNQFFSQLVFRKLNIFFDSVTHHKIEDSHRSVFIINLHWFSFGSRLSLFSKKKFEKTYQIFLALVLKNFFFSKNDFFDIKVVFTRKPSASVIGNFIRSSLRFRMKPYRIFKLVRILVRRFNFLGVKVLLSGRFTRRQRAVQEQLLSGAIPCSTLSNRLSVDYSFSFVKLRNGVCGIKVWLCRKRKFLKIC